ncbi:hypothetical protein BP00DRAFT_30042 [Aspergillus indologenus CBS 114.80]|uniref:Uncharacterized protein n=1 Tax=Aspergillus indologenus CBS 114.80 TaxID=1450541 RepID=A0A2V5HU29_9EURO|nr:hypothetical protein BP00DRAFT_30042 [Aspergillus indologenus CBS 114.80]
MVVVVVVVVMGMVMVMVMMMMMIMIIKMMITAGERHRIKVTQTGERYNIGRFTGGFSQYGIVRRSASALLCSALLCFALLCFALALPLVFPLLSLE